MKKNMDRDNTKSHKCAKRVAASKFAGVYAARIDGRAYRSISSASFLRLARLTLPQHDHDSRPVMAFIGHVPINEYDPDNNLPF